MQANRHPSKLNGPIMFDMRELERARESEGRKEGRKAGRERGREERGREGERERGRAGGVERCSETQRGKYDIPYTFYRLYVYIYILYVHGYMYVTVPIAAAKECAHIRFSSIMVFMVLTKGLRKSEHLTQIPLPGHSENMVICTGVIPQCISSVCDI